MNCPEPNNSTRTFVKFFFVSTAQTVTRHCTARCSKLVCIQPLVHLDLLSQLQSAFHNSTAHAETYLNSIPGPLGLFYSQLQSAFHNSKTSLVISPCQPSSTHLGKTVIIMIMLKSIICYHFSSLTHCISIESNISAWVK